MQPTEEAAAPYAFRVLAAVRDNPGRTTDALKKILGITTQSVSARLSDLVDFGLVRDTTRGQIVRGNSTSDAKTYHVTDDGWWLLDHGDRASEILRAAFSAHREVQIARAADMAEKKRFWREASANAARGVIRESMVAPKKSASDLL